MKTTTLPLRNLMNRSPLRAFLLIPFALACFALSPTVRAVDPPPDGGYPGFNTAEGDDALFNLDTSQGTNNTAIGVAALFSNTTGSNNTADGFQALLNNTTGSFNIAVGNGAGGNLTTGINNIDIGNNGVAGESKTIRIGKSGKQTNTFIAGISGATVPTGVAVIVDASGHLGTTTSSARFKEAIKPMDKASEAILALKPVTFQYKKELDPAGVPQFRSEERR